MFLVSLYCKHYGPRSDCSFWSSLVRVHSVCFRDRISLEWIGYIQQKKNWQYIQDKNIGRIRVKKFKWANVLNEEKANIVNLQPSISFLTIWKKRSFIERTYNILILCPLGIFSCLFVVCWIFFKINIFEKNFQEYHLSVKQVGSRSGPMLCLQRLWADNTRR